MGSLLAELRQQCDVVIIDTPPLLRVGDTMAMSVYVDALVMVARMNVVSRPMLTEVARLLRRMRAVKLGVVVTGASTGDSYGGAYYGYSSDVAAGGRDRGGRAADATMKPGPGAPRRAEAPGAADDRDGLVPRPTPAA